MGLRWVPKNLQRKKKWLISASFLEHFSEHFGAHFGTRSAKEGARWAQESHQELQRAKKLHFQKPWKTFSFLVFLDPEASQENLKRPEKAPKRHPKRHPKVVQKLVKKWSKSEPKNEQKKRFLILKKSLWPPPFGAFLRPWGYLKTLTSKMSSRWPKNCSRCLKTIPKWFQNGSRFPNCLR